LLGETKEKHGGKFPGGEKGKLEILTRKREKDRCKWKRENCKESRGKTWKEWHGEKRKIGNTCRPKGK